jgi:predicted nucleotidyltransferase
MGISFFVVGATARDILLDVAYGLRLNRSTIDIDVAVFVESWDQFERIKDRLIRSGDFSLTHEMQRLLFQERLPVDIVPFGGVAEKDDVIEWPPDRSFRMSVAGFQECYQHAVQVKIADNPELAAKVVSLAGLAILKLISWDDNSDRRQKDASDLVLIIKNYLDAGNLERLFEEAPDIVNSSVYDYELGSARLLARDISKIALPTTMTKLIRILEGESQREQGHRIAMEILRGRRFGDKSYEDTLALLEALLKGLTDAERR